VPAALSTGLRYKKPSKKLHFAGRVLSITVIFVCGIAWLCWSTGISITAAVLIDLVPFIPGDILKVSAVYLIPERFP
jgi:biotin transport system substrate-specific component